MKDHVYVPPILIVDDDDDIRDILSYGFTASGFNVLTANSAESALEILKENKFDLVITDVQMKGMTGIELCRIIKNKYELDVIIITGLVNNFAYEEIIAEGASDFIEKPIRLAEVVARAKRLIGFRRQIILKEAENKELTEKLQNIIVGGSSEDNIKIIRSIEFEPEFFQTGVHILSYFGTVLRKKLPKQKAKVIIEQDDLKVKMVIDTEQGEREVIEKALDDYGLVLCGEMPINDFADDKLFLIELKNELRLAETRIESQKDIIAYQKEEIEKQFCLLSQFLSTKSQSIVVNVPVTASADTTSSVEINQYTNISTNLQLMHDSLNNLSKEFDDGSSEKEYLDELTTAIEKLKESKSKDEISKSQFFAKINKFVSNIQNAESFAGKIIKTAKDGIDVGRKLCKYYNKIAEWCGMPQVPSPFVKK